MTACGRPSLVEMDSWAVDVKAAINDFVTQFGKNSPNYHGRPYVVSDFDNTSCIFDIENQALVYQIMTMDFPLDPAGFRNATERGTPAQYLDVFEDVISAYTKLYAAYGPFRYPIDERKLGKILSDDQWKEFSSKAVFLADKISLFDWKVRWLCGHTADEIYRMCMRSLEKYTAMETEEQVFEGPENIESRAGPVTSKFTNGLTVTENTKELWRVLSENGFDIWVCSASEINQVMAAMDFFGLRKYVKAVTAKTMKFAGGIMVPEYDYDGKARYPVGKGWESGKLSTRGTCAEEGKVDAILNAIAPMYGGKGPCAAFVDSTGDFNFCTEFSSIKLVMVVNRADRSVKDGGALLAEMAMCQRDRGCSLGKCIEAGDTYYVLQGRSIQGMRSFVCSNMSYVLDNDQPVLFKNEDNYRQYQYIRDHGLGCDDAFRLFSVRRSSDSEDNPLGFDYGFLESYHGYHSR